MTCTYTPSAFCGVSSRLGFGAFILAAARGGAPGIVWAADDPPTAISDQPDMTWFTDARLGIFIHWGIYSEGKGSESWAFQARTMVSWTTSSANARSRDSQNANRSKSGRRDWQSAWNRSRF